MISKLRTLEQMSFLRAQLKQDGRIVVFTNGCFDLLHPGHVRYLATARALGDHLVVAVNSDDSVRIIKGPGRPVLGEQARAELLTALSTVDSVLLFAEPDPLRVIQTLVPDILVKGGDWAEEEIVGAGLVRAAGGRVHRIPYIPGYSTSDIITRILKLPT